MNKPPEKIRVVMNRYRCIVPDAAPIYEWDREHPDCTPHTEHFYTLEKPMTQKTSHIKDTYIFDESIQGYRGALESEKQMCEDIKRPMTQKTENLTTEEAWAAMARGECVKAHYYVHRIRENVFQFFNGEKWLSSCELDSGPYSIVPDPPKPKDIENEYNEDKRKLLKDFDNTKSFKMATKSLIEFIELNFEKRKP